MSQPPPPPADISLQVNGQSDVHKKSDTVNVTHEAVTCWCLSLKRRSVHDRVLEETCHCPRCVVMAYQVIEEVRWIFNRIFLWRPFTMVATQCESKCPGFIFDYFVPISLADIISLTLFIILQIAFLSEAFQEESDTKGTVDEKFQAFAKELGNVAVKNYALTWAFGTRNTVWNLVLGLPFERAIKYHRWLGRYSIALAFIHTIAYWNIWTKDPSGTAMKVNSQVPKYLAGYVAMVSSGLIFFFSLNWFRRHTFEFFVKSHWFFFILVAYYLDKHADDVMEFDNLMLIALILWCADVCWRIWLSFSPFKKVQCIALKLLPGNVIRLIFTKNNFVYESGQYLFVCIPALDFTQWHPFSISSCPQDEYVMLHIRVLGGWTQRLRDFASRKDIDWSQLTVYIEGPYGSLSVPLHYYEHVIMISGGIGITPMQSIFNELIHEINDGRVMKRLHFVWSVRDISMIDEFAQQQNRSNPQNNVHWSQVSYGDINDQRENASNRLPASFSPDMMYIAPSRRRATSFSTNVLNNFYLTRVPDGERKADLERKFPFLFFGRPNIRDILKEAKDQFLEEGNAIGSSVYGVAVLSCGPIKMVADVKRWSAYYGIACHTEVFDF